MAALAVKIEGSSKVPTFKIIELGLAGLLVTIAVPHYLQNKRVTALSKSFLLKVWGSSFKNLKPFIGIIIITLGFPPVMYWHSLQWHWIEASGSPSAIYLIFPQ